MIVTKKIFYSLIVVLLFTTHAAKAQQLSIAEFTNSNEEAEDTLGQMIQVRKIIITGNQKTKSYIITREMQISEGDYIPIKNLRKRISSARKFVYNTTLFTEVTINVDNVSSTQIDIRVDLKERWYIFPIPQFQLVDRNLSDWIHNHGAQLSRVNYGIKFTHNNLTGRRDQLKITALNGFSRSLGFSYTQPYSNKTLTEGFSIGTAYTQTREITYKTVNDSTLSYNTAGFNNTLWQVNAAYIKRAGVKNRYVLGFSYSNITVPDSIIMKKFNPHYFNDSSARQHIFDLSFSYQFIDVDNIAYPLEGNNYFATISKRGFDLKGGINMLSLEAGYNTYIDLKKNWYYSVLSSAKIKLPFEQAYINQRGLGYGENYLRGMENYVVDGVAYVLAKNTLKKKILSFKIRLPKRFKTINNIPFSIFAKTYTDIGYVYNKKEYETYFNRRFLYTGGFGLDILTLYDSSIRLEYSFNQKGEKGLFLRLQAGL